eukprot:TRINITY_DN1611_c0_g2_i1.p1 TRINITY_DN1611_c0_g2~~TRINITY_DN1611_c0_g2_i1.p1  ORF type:complete len:444 (+),score=137.16 TRINITY_DN1611_c0_g2_i1:988-2319(+)
MMAASIAPPPAQPSADDWAARMAAAAAQQQQSPPQSESMAQSVQMMAASIAPPPPPGPVTPDAWAAAQMLAASLLRPPGRPPRRAVDLSRSMAQSVISLGTSTSTAAGCPVAATDADEWAARMAAAAQLAQQPSPNADRFGQSAQSVQMMAESIAPPPPQPHPDDAQSAAPGETGAGSRPTGESAAPPGAGAAADWTARVDAVAQLLQRSPAGEADTAQILAASLLRPPESAQPRVGGPRAAAQRADAGSTASPAKLEVELPPSRAVSTTASTDARTSPTAGRTGVMPRLQPVASPEVHASTAPGNRSFSAASEWTACPRQDGGEHRSAASTPRACDDHVPAPADSEQALVAELTVLDTRLAARLVRAACLQPAQRTGYAEMFARRRHGEQRTALARKSMQEAASRRPPPDATPPSTPCSWPEREWVLRELASDYPALVAAAR